MAGERPAIRALADRLHRDAGGRSGGDQRLRGRVCLQIASIAPGAPVDRLLLLVRHALWSFRLDDRLDDQATGETAMARLRDGVGAVTAGRVPDSGEPLLVELAGIITDLSHHDPTGALRARYGEALRDAVAADVAQVRRARAVASGAAPAPLLPEYLTAAARSVNYHSFGYALLAVAAAPLAPASLDRLAPSLVPASYAVRLANDLRSADRDRAEAGLNVLDLRTSAGEPVGRRWVRRQIRRYQRAHERILSPLAGGELAVAARALRRSLRISVDFYRFTDFRD